MKRKSLHYTNEDFEVRNLSSSNQAYISLLFITLGVCAVVLFFESDIAVTIQEGLDTFYTFLLVSVPVAIYKTLWILSAVLVLYGFVCLGWFRVMTRITTVLTFIVMFGVINDVSQIGILKTIHDAIHTFLIPAYESGYIIFSTLFAIVYPLCYLAALAVRGFFSLPVINIIFRITCWIVETIFGSLPSFNTIVSYMEDIARNGRLSNFMNSMDIAFNSGKWGAYLGRLPRYMDGFFDTMTYFIIMFVITGAFIRVVQFTQCFIFHGLSNYFTQDNENDEKMEDDEALMEVIHRSKRRHPFKMPNRISIRISPIAAHANAFVTSRKAVYIDPDILEDNKGVLAHELGHVVHADSLDTRIKYTFYFSCMVALLGTLISLIRTAFSNPLFFIIGVLAGGFVLFSLSLALSAANIITFLMNAFSGKWQEFRADMYAVSLGYGVELMEFFGCDGWSFGAILSANDTFDRRTLMGAISDPHPSEKHRCLYLCATTRFLSYIPFTRYWRMRREG